MQAFRDRVECPYTSHAMFVNVSIIWIQLTLSCYYITLKSSGFTLTGGIKLYLRNLIYWTIKSWNKRRDVSIYPVYYLLRSPTRQFIPSHTTTLFNVLLKALYWGSFRVCYFSVYFLVLFILKKGGNHFGCFQKVFLKNFVCVF